MPKVVGEVMYSGEKVEGGGGEDERGGGGKVYGAWV